MVRTTCSSPFRRACAGVRVCGCAARGDRSTTASAATRTWSSTWPATAPDPSAAGQEDDGLTGRDRLAALVDRREPQRDLAAPLDKRAPGDRAAAPRRVADEIVAAHLHCQPPQYA